MGHGMGIPSVSIYAKELITDYGVETLIRVGSCGAVRDDIHLRDLVIGMGASTDSKVNRMRFMDHDLAALADFDLVAHAVDVARERRLPFRVGNLFSADLFYSAQPELFDLMKRYGIVGIEMEAAGLYGVAAEYGARAMTICTVSDHLSRGEALSADDRQNTFNEMIEVTLEAVLRDDSTPRQEA